MAFDALMAQLRHRGFWGPFLVVAGLVLLYFSSNYVQPRAFDYAMLGAGSLVVLAGVALMFRQLGAPPTPSAYAPGKGHDDATYLVQQLHRNFEILRAQTNQGFLLSSVFMAIGLALIVLSLFAPSLGLKTEGISGLGVLAGVVTEFISATALVLYRLNFARLNQTSDRLDDAWRVLAAFKLTTELPEEKRSEATLQLVTALTRSSR
jgi:hypothetical protein